MKDKLLLIWKHLKPENLQKMWLQSKWIWQYGKRYWKSMVVYTLLGIAGSGVSLVSSFISKDLIDIITGHQTGKLLSTFAAMIGFSIANILFSQASTYASTFINLKVDSEIKNDIFAKMLVTDWESLTDYHTGDLVTRWSSDASNQCTFRRSLLRPDLCPVCPDRHSVQCDLVKTTAPPHEQQQCKECRYERQNVWI